MSHPFFSLGFRPFFLLASGYAVFHVIYWVLGISGGHSLNLIHYTPLIWHVHEMIYGFSMAVISGFLLTAVRNWTKLETARGAVLAGLCLVWLLARMAPFFTLLNAAVVALLDVIYIPLLALILSRPLIRSGNKRNYFILFMMMVWFVLNVLIHLSLLSWIDDVSLLCSKLAFYLIMVLLVVIAGRVFPMFSQNGVFRQYQVKNHFLVEKLAVPSVLILGLADLLLKETNPQVFTVIAVIVAMIHALRSLGWYSHLIWKVPLVWVLHLGYLMLSVGCLIFALSALGFAMSSLAFHALSVGCLSLIILGMMSRVSWGHTGRNLHQPPKVLFLIFISLLLAVFFRVFAPLWSGQNYLFYLSISMVFWSLAFGIYFIRYLPVLFQKRVDHA